MFTSSALHSQVCLFQFVNSYISLFYVAFIKATGITLPWIPWETYTLYNVSSVGLNSSLGTTDVVHSELRSRTYSAEYCHDLGNFELDEAQIRREHGGVNPFCMEELEKMLAIFIIVSQVMGMVVGFMVPWLSAWIASNFEEWWLRHMVDPPDTHDVSGGDRLAVAPSPSSGPCGSTLDQEAVGPSACQSRTSSDHSQGGEGDSDGGRSNGIRAQLSRHFLFRLLRGILCPICAGNEKVQAMSVYEEQAKLAKFDAKSGLSGVIPKYTTLVIQIGYILLFAPAFPLAALVCLLSNLVRIRADAYLLLYNTQRPPYRCSHTIGSFMGALRTLAVLAVATHVGLLVFTSTQLHEVLPFRIPGVGTITEDDKFTLVVVLEHLFLVGYWIINQLLDVFLPAVPKATSIWKAIERQHTLNTDRATELL